MRHPIAALERFATDLFVAAKMDEDKAATVARLLILTDAMGRRTHGLAISPLYLAEIEKGGMHVTGTPAIESDNGICAVWDGDYLPGLWLMNHAIEVAIPRAEQLGLAAIAIRKSHHIGCLATLAKQAADKGFVALIFNSDPSGKRVAPFGGTEPLFTPNPYAIGYPGAGHPVLVDSCASITTVSMTRQKYAAGEQFDQPWLIDADGRPTRDPAVLEHAQPPGSLLPVGGLEYGHKGFGLALMVEALSQGLSGQGRADAPTRWGGNTYLQLIDPRKFAGVDAFSHQMDFLSAQCRANRPIDPAKPVRVPGDNAAKGIDAATVDGIEYDAATWNALAPWMEKLGVRVQ